MPEHKAESRATDLKAISLAEEAQRHSPNDAPLRSFLGYYYAEVGTAGKSLPLLRQAVVLAPDDPQVLYRVAEGYEVLHRRHEALQWISRAFTHGLAAETVLRNPELAALAADQGLREAATGKVR